MDLPLLGELETAVLEHLWEHGVTEAKDLHRQLGSPRGITLSTIQSALERLHRKRSSARTLRPCIPLCARAGPCRVSLTCGRGGTGDCVVPKAKE